MYELRNSGVRVRNTQRIVLLVPCRYVYIIASIRAKLKQTLALKLTHTSV